MRMEHRLLNKPTRADSKHTHAIFRRGKEHADEKITHNTFKIYSEILKVTDNMKCLTFRGPHIVVNSYNKSQRDAVFLKFI